MTYITLKNDLLTLKLTFRVFLISTLHEIIVPRYCVFTLMGAIGYMNTTRGRAIMGKNKLLFTLIYRDKATSVCHSN